MTINSIPLETIVAAVMLLLGVVYVFRERVARFSWPGLTRPSRSLDPTDVLRLVERSDCPRVREHLVAALNCLLEVSDAPTD